MIAGGRSLAVATIKTRCEPTVCSVLGEETPVLSPLPPILTTLSPLLNSFWKTDFLKSG
jgi:hypothetical protein